MSVEGKRQLIRAARFTLIYGVVAFLVLVFAGIRACSMQPDVAAMCDTTPVEATFVVLLVVYLALLALIFRTRTSGKR